MRDKTPPKQEGPNKKGGPKAALKFEEKEQIKDQNW
jgi:hypothetical protein